MRDIKYIVLHCTAGSAQQKTSDILTYWKYKLGWKKRGYHFLVDYDGTIEQLTPLEEISNGVEGYNRNSIHVCYKGGWNGKDTRTTEQCKSLRYILCKLKSQFPEATITGHRYLSPDLDRDGVVEPHEWVKLCPCFNPILEYMEVNEFTYNAKYNDSVKLQFENLIVKRF